VLHWEVEAIHQVGSAELPGGLVGWADLLLPGYLPTCCRKEAGSILVMPACLLLPRAIWSRNLMRWEVAWRFIEACRRSLQEALR
jgi:hypothetical protein